MEDNLEVLRKENEVLDIFCNLVKIPSPSMKEEKLISWIRDFCRNNNINEREDNYGNVYITVSATDNTKEPIMLSSHLDVVGDKTPIELEFDGQYIKAHERTLGADDKVGVACGIMLALDLTRNPISHGGLEICFTRDEESGMSGVKHIEFDKLNSKHILVCDADKLGQLQISGASYTIGRITVESTFGGHSGIDIGDKNRLNAAKLTAELIAKFPQGVYYSDETGVITSCNLGAIVAGGVQNPIANIVENNIKSTNYIQEVMKNSTTNVINTLGMASYSIRSASVEKENELKSLMENIVKEFNAEYEDLATAKIEFIPHVQAFEKAPDDRIEKIHTIACKKAGIENDISSFHAAAETHIYCQQTNANGDKFMPVLLGLADIYNMHSDSERVDYRTLLTGYQVIKNTFIEFNNYL